MIIKMFFHQNTSSQNDHQCNYKSTTTNTFNRRNHFTIIWIGQINCFGIKVGNHNLTTQTTNAESRFVYIIYVVLVNTVLYLRV